MKRIAAWLLTKLLRHFLGLPSVFTLRSPQRVERPRLRPQMMVLEERLPPGDVLGGVVMGTQGMGLRHDPLVNAASPATGLTDGVLTTSLAFDRLSGAAFVAARYAEARDVDRPTSKTARPEEGSLDPRGSRRDELASEALTDAPVWGAGDHRSEHDQLQAFWSTVQSPPQKGADSGLLYPGDAGSSAADIHYPSQPTLDLRSKDDPSHQAIDTSVGATVAGTGGGSSPVAPGVSASTDEDTPVAVDVLAYAYDPDEDPLTISVAAGPSSGTAAVDDRGTPSNPNDDLITYTPNPNFHGTDSFSYRVDDGHGHTATGTVNLTVNSVNDAYLFPPYDQLSAEGEEVSVQMETPRRVASTLTFSATGLPSGLSINSSSGLITGTPPYTAAGLYHVTVTASGAGDTDSKSFDWTVADTNRLTRPDDQAGCVGQPASEFDEKKGPGGPPGGGPYIYGATGLPPSLAINPTTGAISGTLTGPAGVYTVTMTLTGDGATDTQTFTWTVFDAPGPHLVIAINNTLRPDDDITVVDPVLPVPARVRLVCAPPGMHHVTISVVPASRASLDNSAFDLASGGSANLTITPLQVSAEEDDVFLQAKANGQDAGGKKMTNAFIDIPKNVRAPNTPTGMLDRIPPRVTTEFDITVAPKLNVKELKLHIVGGAAAGRAYFSAGGTDTSSITVKESQRIRIRGGNQTQPAKKEPPSYQQLRLVATADQVTVNKSGWFSVAAIPYAVNMKDAIALAGANIGAAGGKYELHWGAHYTVTYKSDSKEIEDLNLVRIMERVQVKSLIGAATKILKSEEGLVAQ